VRLATLPASLNDDGRTRGAPDAAVCMLSYLAVGQSPVRPVCFAFNGGPGASSAFLNVGAFGPRRVVFPEGEGHYGLPVLLEDNPHNLLHICDVVFVDPPGAGFSRLLTDTAEQAHSVDGDARLLIDAIRNWLDRNGRWSSPVYICGESYGGMRAAAIADAALDDGIAVAGLMLVSPVIDMQPVECVDGNDIAYALRLPSYAATAAYHGCLKGNSTNPVDAYRRAERLLATEGFGFGPTTGISVRSNHTAKESAASKWSELIGVSARFIADRSFEVAPNDFAGELLRDRHQVIGKLDARVVGSAGRRAQGEEDDASIDAVYAPIATAMRIVLREELAVDWSASYEGFAHSVYGSWRWNRGGITGNRYTTVSADLARAMRRNPAMRLWICSGRFDLITPTTSIDWSLMRLDIPDEARAAIQHEVLESGHMVYTSDAAHVRMMASLRRWFEPSV
jgi:carboxypeptidase C (cathepsin A)